MADSGAAAAVSPEERKALIRQCIEQMSMASAHSKKELISKFHSGCYDGPSSLGTLVLDVLNEGIDPEKALDGLSKLLNEPLPVLEKRSRKPVDRRLTGITESPSSKGARKELSYVCGVCFQVDVPPDDSCEVCGLAVHSRCAQFEDGEGSESNNQSPFRIDLDKGIAKRTCGYCRAARKMTARGVKDVQSPGNVICEICNQAGKDTLLTNLSGAPTKWVHVCCGRFLPGCSLGFTGARRYTGADKDTLSCVLCGNKTGVVTKCIACEDDAGANVHVYCALSKGGYGIAPLNPLHPSKRLLCQKHKVDDNVAHAQALAVPTGPLLPIVATLQASTVSETESTPCGFCLSSEVRPNDPTFVCDGCDVRLHKGCYLSSAKFRQKDEEDLDSGREFYCRRCIHNKNRGVVGKCRVCPHVSPFLALQPMDGEEHEYVHALCHMRTSEDALLRINTHPDNRRCEVCQTKGVALSTCLECGKPFHAMCVALICPEKTSLDPGQKITRCLSHCTHAHAASRIAPIVTENSVGTACRPFRRVMSAVCNLALDRSLTNQSAKGDMSIIPEWLSYDGPTKQALLVAPVIAASDAIPIPEVLVQRTLGAIARAWDQTKADSDRKRGRMSNEVRVAMAPVPRASHSNGIPGPTRSSGRVQRRSYNDEGPNGISYAGHLKAHDAPIEVQEVWPMLEPIFRKPASTTRLVEMLERDRAVDDILLSPSNNCPLPPIKLFPEQPHSVNPFVPPSFEKYTPLERSKGGVLPSNVMRQASFRDVFQFAERRCCLGRRRNDLDIASLNLLTVRGMGLPSHLFLLHGGVASGEDQGTINGVSHCTYLENDVTRLAFIKVNADSPEVALTLFITSLSGPMPPSDAAIETVYISGVTREQETEFWHQVFPNALTQVPFDHPADAEDFLLALDLKRVDWRGCIKSFMSSEARSSPGLKDCLERTFQPHAFPPSDNFFRARLRLTIEPKPQEVDSAGIQNADVVGAAHHLQPSLLLSGSFGSPRPVPHHLASGSNLAPPPLKPSWAFTFRLEEPLPIEISTHAQRWLANIALPETLPSDVLDGSVMDDPNLPNTLSKQIERLQKELTAVCDANDKAVELLRIRVQEDQARLKQVQRAESEVERPYRERKRQLDDRLAAIRSQAEKDATARCSLCKGDESYSNNPIIICERCSGAAHQHCLGLSSVPEEDWYCDKCINKVGTEFTERKRGRPRRKMASTAMGHKKQFRETNGHKTVSNADQGGVSVGENSNGTLDDESRSAPVLDGARLPFTQQLTSQDHEEGGHAPLLCICQSTSDEERFMLCCDQCSGWFHPVCIGLLECMEANHTNCVVLEDGTHTMDVADWTFLCPNCAQTAGKPSLVRNARSRRGTVPVESVAATAMRIDDDES